MPRHSSCLQTARYLAAHIRETVPLELALGLAWLAVLLTMKHLGKTRRWAAKGSMGRQSVPARSSQMRACWLTATCRQPSSARFRIASLVGWSMLVGGVADGNPACRRRLRFLRPLGPLTVAALSIACVQGLGIKARPSTPTPQFTRVLPFRR